MRTVVPLVGLVLLAAATPLQPPPTGPEETDAPPRIVHVRMTDAGGGQWRFVPDAITASPGDVVRFVLDDVIPHNVEFKDVPPGTELGNAAMGPFLLRKGDTYDVAIDDRFAPGKHRFVCTPHEIMGMVGTLEVRPSADTTQPR